MRVREGRIRRGDDHRGRQAGADLLRERRARQHRDRRGCRRAPGAPPGAAAGRCSSSKPFVAQATYMPGATAAARDPCRKPRKPLLGTAISTSVTPASAASSEVGDLEQCPGTARRADSARCSARRASAPAARRRGPRAASACRRARTGSRARFPRNRCRAPRSASTLRRRPLRPPPDQFVIAGVGRRDRLRLRVQVQRVEVHRRQQQLREAALADELRHHRARIREQHARADARDRALGVVLGRGSASGTRRPASPRRGTASCRSASPTR